MTTPTQRKAAALSVELRYGPETERLEQRYRDHWTIYYDPPPIPTRAHDWHFVHDGYDGPGDTRHGDAPSAEACRAEIDEMEEGL